MIDMPRKLGSGNVVGNHPERPTGSSARANQSALVGHDDGLYPVADA